MQAISVLPRPSSAIALPDGHRLAFVDNLGLVSLGFSART
jgi:hypothetical protein